MPSCLRVVPSKSIAHLKAQRALRTVPRLSHPSQVISTIHLSLFGHRYVSPLQNLSTPH